jgi:hypothetical protein
VKKLSSTIKTKTERLFQISEDLRAGRSFSVTRLTTLKSLQDTYENQRWGPVRIISSSEALVIEYAVECFLSTSQAPNWAYRLARTYAEEYDSRFGDGLVPKSAPMVEEIAKFWKKWYLNRAKKK